MCLFCFSKCLLYHLFIECMPVWYLMGILFKYTIFIFLSKWMFARERMCVCICLFVWLIIQVICSENNFYYYQFKISHCQSHTVQYRFAFIFQIQSMDNRFWWWWTPGNSWLSFVIVCTRFCHRFCFFFGFYFLSFFCFKQNYAISLLFCYTSLSLKFVFFSYAKIYNRNFRFGKQSDSKE